MNAIIFTIIIIASCAISSHQQNIDDNNINPRLTSFNHYQRAIADSSAEIYPIDSISANTISKHNWYTAISDSTTDEGTDIDDNYTDDTDGNANTNSNDPSNTNSSASTLSIVAITLACLFGLALIPLYILIYRFIKNHPQLARPIANTVKNNDNTIAVNPTSFNVKSSHQPMFDDEIKLNPIVLAPEPLLTAIPSVPELSNESVTTVTRHYVVHDVRCLINDDANHSTASDGVSVDRSNNMSMGIKQSQQTEMNKYAKTNIANQTPLRVDPGSLGIRYETVLKAEEIGELSQFIHKNKAVHEDQIEGQIEGQPKIVLR